MRRLMHFAFIALAVLLLPLPALSAHATPQPSQTYTVSGSVVKAGSTWTYAFPATQVSNDLTVQTTIGIKMSPLEIASPNCFYLSRIQPTCGGGGGGGGSGQVTASSWEEVRWTRNIDGATVMYTISILQVNYYPGGTITGVGPCNTTNCSTGYVDNGYALCSGPTDLVGGAQTTIAYSQTNQGGASGFLLDHGIASYPEVQYNSINNVWTYRSPDFTGWTFGGVQCTGWSFSFPSP